MQQSNLRTLRIVRMVLWALVVVVAIGASALYFLRPPERPLGLNGQSFAMTSLDGEQFTEADLRGTPSLLFFGFTHCPDVCPTTLGDTAYWRDRLDLSQDDLRVIFVTVDPQRDTQEQLEGYLAGWDGSVIGLRGTEEQTEDIKSAFGVFSERVGDGDEYTVNHTASVFMIDDDGSFEGTIAYQEDTETALAKIERLVEG
ncbi:electron transporter SenC [Devosia pacifica]|uniref:Electron transporter SenC n=1 Tax=Devosia pacifica TaxID=1335967 RepID=A0A918VUH4_9HYPH|nr:SCO family protein [Devosia pacifica]GHA30160.1 electron transporter SenC [Devosia pacifica]